MATESVITNLSPAHLDAYVSLAEEFLREQSVHDAELAPPSDWKEKARAFYEQHLDFAGTFIRLITWDGKPFGFCLSTVNEVPLLGRRVGYIAGVYVRPKVRGYSFGSALVRDALEILKAHGVASVQADVLDATPGAEGFWKRFGFRPHLKRMRLAVE